MFHNRMNMGNIINCAAKFIKSAEWFTKWFKWETHWKFASHHSISIQLNDFSLANVKATRMHSISMRTTRALTVSERGGVGASQKKFWGKKFEKKDKKRTKKIWRPPEKLETPQKIGDPSKNWRPPEKLETHPPCKIGDPQKNWRPP